LFDSPARKEKKYDDTLVPIVLGTLLFAAPLPHAPTSLRFPLCLCVLIFTLISKSHFGFGFPIFKIACHILPFLACHSLYSLASFRRFFF
jgi:hypothetical protein